MATLLDGVNRVLQRVGLIAGDQGELTTLVDSARQQEIDNAVQVWNEVIEDLYDLSKRAMPKESAEADITLQTGVREYDLPNNLVQIRWPLIDETNNHYISQFPGGFAKLRAYQVNPDEFTGRPYRAVISPITDKLYMEHIPTAAEDGSVYKLFYDKDISLSVAADEFPFRDVVFRSLTPAVIEAYQYYRKGKDVYVDATYQRSMAKAARYLRENVSPKQYIPRRTHNTDSVFDPFEDK